MGVLEEKLYKFKINKYKDILRIDIDKIKVLREEYEKLSLENISEKTQKLKAKLESGYTLDDILIDAYALVIEVIRREKGFLLHDNQIMCAMIISGYKNDSNCLAEMKTGEGKTLSGVLAAYLNALTGEGVHIITSNDHLAERDYKNNENIFKILGLSSGVLTSDGVLSIEEKREIYKRDIVYASTHQIGFDYLRDNICIDHSQRVLRELNYVIIDEVDDVILDQSQVPMILSGTSKFEFLSYDILNKIDSFISTLTHKTYFGESNISNFNPIFRDAFDFVISIEKKQKNIILGDSGYEKTKEFFEKLLNQGLINIDIEQKEKYYNEIFLPAVNNALMANYVIEVDNNYKTSLTSNGIQIDIIDQNTGRKLEGQKFSLGLHQALQVKEAKKIVNNSNYTEEEKKCAEHIDKIQSTQGFITFPSFLRLYKKFSGMSGTLLESSEELRSLYDVDVVDVESHKENIRQDRELEVFEKSSEKLKRILQIVEFHHKNQQPILIGTVSIKDSLYIAEELKRKGYKVEVLNALTQEDIKKESKIIEQAGKSGSIVVATNLAGRGTDIKLDEISKQNGGLCVIGTSLNSSQRSDNQLRGRAGRQGDPGITYLLTSLEDEIYLSHDIDNIENFDSIEALKIQSKQEKNQFSMLLHQQKFYAYIDSFRETYYTIRNAIIDQKDPFEILKFISFYIKDQELLKYLTILNECSQNNFIAGLKIALKKVLNNSLEKMDDIWGSFIENLPNLMNQINLNLTFGKSTSIAYDKEISDSLCLLIESMLNEVLTENIKTNIKSIKKIIENTNTKRR